VRRAQVDNRPNVVVLMTDDQTLEALRVMGQTRALLGGQGTTFRRMIVSFPLCCPSRATLLTGQYAHNHRVIHNAGPVGGYPRLKHSNALPVWLQRAGYRTIQLGRYLNGYGTTVAPTTIPPGWTDWHAAPQPGAFNYSRWDMNDNGHITSNPTPGHLGEHQTEFYGRRASELIREAAPAAGPFFMQVTFSAPHSGAPRDPDDPSRLSTPSPAPRYRNAFAGKIAPRNPAYNEADVSDKPDPTVDLAPISAERAAAIDENYSQELESLLSVDDAVASVVGALRQSGELDNTLIVFTSDNGFMHGEHRWESEKVLPYEPAIRVPLIMRGPGVPRGRVEQRLVSNIDLAPTILKAARAAPGRREDGRSLLSFLKDPGREWGRDILLEDGQGAGGVTAYRGIRTYRYMYVDYFVIGEEELYDLRRDPFELRNLAGKRRYEPIREAMSRRAFRLHRCRGARCRARPRLRVALHCTGRRNLLVQLRGPDVLTVTRMNARVGRTRVAVDRHPPFLERISRRRARSGRRLRVRITTRDGRIVTLDRHPRRCRPRR
jgi:N-acetylglucosamine-6-sulfatase